MARAFRVHALQCANYLIHTSSTRLGIIPPLNEVTPDFKTGLKIALGFGKYGPRIFHGRQDSDSDPVISDVCPFILFILKVQSSPSGSCSETSFFETSFERLCTTRKAKAGSVFWKTQMGRMGPSGRRWGLPTATRSGMSVLGYVRSTTPYTIHSIKSSQLIEAANDFCDGVNPPLRLTEAKMLKVNSLAKKIGSTLNEAMIGVPGVPVAVQNAVRMSLVPFTRRG